MSLYLYNSLTKKKEKFRDPDDQIIKWYTCGPTVYDKSHLGHARTFVSLDIMRRVMKYLGYNIIYAMNITDIDDKIIKRVQESSILPKYLDKLSEQVLIGESDILSVMTEAFPKSKVLIGNLSYLIKNHRIPKSKIYEFLCEPKWKDFLLKYHFENEKLDVELDDLDYYELTKRMESEFWRDMDDLGIDRPNIVTRATEYIPKIIQLIEDLEKKGFAYESNGSVYFDSESFKKSGRDMDQFKILKDTDYTESAFLEEKKSKNDFVLWKKAKPGEIKFDSKWGKGRIGWHSECTVMATDVLGSRFDIHSGGIDLKFPHHNNEIVQALAYNDQDKWADVFLHIGHLNINGDKMSKSLSNFITIQSFLSSGSARQLRLMFLIHRWDLPLDLSEDTLNESTQIDKRIKDFMSSMQYLISNKKSIPNTDNINQINTHFKRELFNSKINIETFLRDNINTSFVMREILDVIAKTNIFITRPNYNVTYAIEAHDIVKKYLGIFGLNWENKSSNSDSNKDLWVDLSVRFRQEIRKTLIESKKDMEKETFKKFFSIVDDYRDNKMKKLGVTLEDKGKNEPTKWSYD